MMTPPTSQGPFGQWTHDEFDLPCFDLTVGEGELPYAPFRHLLGSGRLSGFADRWGNLQLFTTEGGQGHLDITTTAHLCRSALYPMLRAGEELISLVPGELTGPRAVRYGVGYVTYRGQDAWPGVGAAELELTIAAAGQPEPCLRGFVRLTNRGDAPLRGSLLICSDLSLVADYRKTEMEPTELGEGVAMLPGVDERIGDYYVVSAEPLWRGVVASLVAIGLQRDIALDPGESVSASVAVGYGDAADREAVTRALADQHLADLSGQWARRVEPAAAGASEPWMVDECRWTYGQLLSFTNRDSVRDEYYVSLGGYGWRGFNQRELGEVAMVLAPWDSELAGAQCRAMAKTQYPGGNLPPGINFRAYRDFDPAQPDCSDTVIWLLLGCGEWALAGGAEVLDGRCGFADDSAGTMWDHCIAGFRFLRDGVGVGPHGLVRSCRGDWNDYLTPVGAGGTGESMMNTGMAARACDTLARLASRRGEADLAEEIGAYLKDLRDAAGRCFDRRQFVRGYTDAGKPVGSADSGRVFLNAQSWPALGGCGTSGQRHAALWTALEHCRTDLGLCLLSRPYPSPPPADESLLPIPAGEGENGGVWPQTVAWAIWALAENGLADEALTVWRAMTLRHHYARFPKTPFGIFNGPDCYNSHLAGERAHWTQIQLWNRQVHTPMNPAVAWQAFALRRINEASR